MIIKMSILHFIFCITIADVVEAVICFDYHTIAILSDNGQHWLV